MVVFIAGAGGTRVGGIEHSLNYLFSLQNWDAKPERVWYSGVLFLRTYFTCQILCR